MFRFECKRTEFKDISNSALNPDKSKSLISNLTANVDNLSTLEASDWFTPSWSTVLMPLEEDKDSQNASAKDEFTEDSFYLDENKWAEFDDVQKILKNYTQNENNADKFTGQSQFSGSFHELVVDSVLKKFSNEESSPEIVGILKKKSEGFIKVWNKRYIVIRDNELYYFSSPKDKTIRGCINFDAFNVSVKLHK